MRKFLPNVSIKTSLPKKTLKTKTQTSLLTHSTFFFSKYICNKENLNVPLTRCTKTDHTHTERLKTMVEITQAFLTVWILTFTLVHFYEVTIIGKYVLQFLSVNFRIISRSPEGSVQSPATDFGISSNTSGEHWGGPGSTPGSTRNSPEALASPFLPLELISSSLKCTGL